MKLYKVLEKNMSSPYQNFPFEIGKKYRCEDFDESMTECSRGFYAVGVEGLPYCFNINRKIFEVEVNGKRVEIDIYKRRFETIKIIKECNLEDIRILAQKEEKKLGYTLSEALFPINPLLLKAPKITEDAMKKVEGWASVGASVRDSVWDSVWASVWASVGASVGASVWDSVGASVRASVRDSVGDSVRDSVWAYISSLFPNIQKWRYIEHEPGINPFQSCIDLWRDGFVPSFDGKTWRLHAGKKAKIVYEWRKP